LGGCNEIRRIREIRNANTRNHASLSADAELTKLLVSASTGLSQFALIPKEMFMFKLFKWLLIAVLVLFGILLVGGYALSPKFTAVRSTVINAPAAKVYGFIAAPRQWKEWTVWNQRDPAMQMTYSGADSGVGAGWEWKSKTQGDGKMMFTSAEPDKRVDYSLFFPDFGTTSTGSLTLAPEGAGTKVTWTMNGDMGSNPLFRWMALFGDRMVGPDFEAGLANLKAVAEKP
jgi:uncharacterized protein YndB with AHSA1/START domain